MLKKTFTLILISNIILSFALRVSAEKLDLETQNVLIQKIENTISQLSVKDTSVDQLGLKAQLANLYAEQARLLFIEEGKQNCNDCQGSNKARQKAVQLYKGVLPQLQGDYKAGVSLQLAYLYEVLNKNKEAIELYNQVIQSAKLGVSKIYIGKAFVSRGNSFFRQGQFIPAQSDFKLALNYLRNEEKGSVLHRLAWTYFNMGEIDTAIAQLKNLLSEPKYLQQVTTEGYQYSETLHADYAQDLAIFLAKSEVSNAVIKQYIGFTPKSVIINHLLFLADECDRLDNAASAIRVWQYALAMEDFPEQQKSIVRVKMARFFREKKQFNESVREFHQSLIDQKKCNSEDCKVYPTLAKNFLTAWDKSIKNRSPKMNLDSARNLLRCYQDYNTNYANELQTLIWQAQLARDIESKKVALDSYHRAADLALSQNQSKIAEEALLAEIKLAEQFNTAEVKITAYKHYIDNSPKGSQVWVVQFALANTYYDLKKYGDSIDIYHRVAHDCPCKKQKNSIALKAAHLELDSLARLDQSEKIEMAAKEYAIMYPQERMIFFKIARMAGFKQAFKLASNKDSDSVHGAIKKINGIPMLGASSDEKASYIKLKMQLAELTLDFETAYQMAIALNYHQSKNASELVKLIMLAELSRHKSNKWVDQVIVMKSPITDKKIAYVLKIRRATNPWPLIEKYAGVLRSDTELFSDLLIEAFVKTKNFNAIDRYIRDPSILKTTNGSALWRMVYLKNLGIEAKKIQTSSLNIKSDHMLASTLKIKLKLLKAFQGQIRKADQRQDWTAKVISRSIYRTENLRLANEIQRLPVPKNLSLVVKEQYRNALVQQARPFINEASVTSQQMDDLWKNQNALEALIEDIRTQAEYRMVYVSEAKAVSIYAPDNIKSNLKQAMTEYPERPSEKQFSKARATVSRDPYATNAISELIELERAAGNKLMVAYLEGRRQFISKSDEVNQ
jgi:tetratricopeptide (TPR) repeat protein